MVRHIGLIAGVVVVSALNTFHLVDAAPAKVDVCHHSNSGWHLINISERAFDTHVGHGDASPGDAVPGVPEHVFDADCVPERETTGIDSDGDGLSDDTELAAGTDPFDADSDDDGAPDGTEPQWAVDTDGDSLINALDWDSDDDGLPDGLELGLDCWNPDTDIFLALCLADQDAGATTTDPLNPNSDDSDYFQSDSAEDRNRNGVVEYELAEHDPNDPTDDEPQPELCGDGIDNDWDLLVDESCP